ncbi:MAG: sensor histidine kinase [Oligoflexales bacterium]
MLLAWPEGNALEFPSLKKNFDSYPSQIAIFIKKGAFDSIRSFAAVTSMGAALFSILAIFALTYFADKLEESSEHILQSAEIVDAAHIIESSLLNHSRENLLFSLTNDPRHLDKRDAAERRAIASVNLAKEHAFNSQDAKLVSEIEHSLYDYFALLKTLESNPITPRELADKVSKYVDEVSSAVDNIVVKTEELINRKLHDSEQWKVSAYEDAKLADTLAIVSGLLIVFVLVVILLWIRNYVYVPLISIVDSLNCFRAGKIVEPPTKGLYELRNMSQTVSGMMRDLQNARERQMQYLASVAHDIRNPIGAIQMSAELGHLKDVGDPEVAEYFEIIARQSQYLNQMVTDLLDITRLEAGKLRFTASLCDLGEVVRGSAQLFEHYSPKHSVSFKGPNAPITASIDAVRISQVVNNLISNAIKYSPEGGKVEVKVALLNDKAVVSVTDQGIGMTSEDVEGIFEPFRRSKLTIDKIPGVGLGLFTAKRIVEAHRGTITVASTLGKGTTFFVTLPIDEISLTPGRRPSAKPAVDWPANASAL